MISSKKSPKIHNQLIRLFKTKIVNSTNLSFLSKVNKSKQQSPEGPKFNKNTDTISDNKQLKEAHLTSTLISIQNLPRVTRGEQTCNLRPPRKTLNARSRPSKIAQKLCGQMDPWSIRPHKSFVT